MGGWRHGVATVQCHRRFESFGSVPARVTRRHFLHSTVLCYCQRLHIIVSMEIDKHPFLAEVGIQQLNPGVFGGSEIGGGWFGAGDVVSSINPATGRVSTELMMLAGSCAQHRVG